MRTLGFAFVGGVITSVFFFAACSSDDSGDGGANDATSSSDSIATNDAGMPLCACPAADAALFTPTNTSCCAGSSWVSAHDDGFGNKFYDCYGVGQWATGLAMDACNRHFDASASCVATTCALSQVVEGTGTTCVTWAYEGSDTSTFGKVHASTNTACVCPDAGSLTWY